MGALSIFARLEDLSSKFMRLQARAARLDETLGEPKSDQEISGMCTYFRVVM